MANLQEIKDPQKVPSKYHVYMGEDFQSKMQVQLPTIIHQGIQNYKQHKSQLKQMQHFRADLNNQMNLTGHGALHNTSSQTSFYQHTKAALHLGKARPDSQKVTTHSNHLQMTRISMPLCDSALTEAGNKYRATATPGYDNRYYQKNNPKAGAQG